MAVATKRPGPRFGIWAVVYGTSACGFTGSYDQVARRIVAFHNAGIEIILLEFQPFEREMRRFAEEVMPRVVRLCSKQ